MSQQSSELFSRYAHIEGKATLALSSDDRLLFTAGEDALLNAYFTSQVIDMDVEPLISARPHGIYAVNCLATFGKCIVTGGADGRVILHTFTPLKDESVIFECSKHIFKVAINEEWICGCTETGEIHVYNRATKDKVYEKEFPAGVKDFILFSKNGLAVSDKGCELFFFDLTNEIGDIKRSLFINDSGLKMSVNASGTFLAVPSGSKLIFINLLDFEIESSVDISHQILGTSWGRNCIACYGDKALTVWSKELNKSVFTFTNCPEVLQDAQVSSTGSTFYAITVGGNLNVLKLPEVKLEELLLFPETLKESLPLAITSIEEKPKKQKKLEDLFQKKKIEKFSNAEERKPKKKKIANHDEELSSEKEPETANNNFDDIFDHPPEATLLPQSSSTPIASISMYKGANHSDWRNDARWLGYNALGKVVNRRVSSSVNIDMEFHDTRSHRPIRFIDDLGLNYCAFDTCGALFGGGRYIKYIPFSNYGVAWTNRTLWFLELAEDESVKSVALRDDKLIVLTDKGFLRPITSTGIQLQPLIAPHGAFSVTLATNGLLVACVTNGLYETALFDLDFNQLATFPFPPKDFFWIGTDESGSSFGAMDREYNFYILESNGWKPVYVYQPAGTVPWPVSFTGEGFKALISPCIPDPLALVASILELVPFKIPLASMSDPVYLLNGSYLALKNSLLSGDKKKATAADKLLLELFQLSIKSELLERAYQVASMLANPKSLEIAIQYSKHSRVTALVEQLEKLSCNPTMESTKPVPSFSTEIPMSQMSTQLPPSESYAASSTFFSGMPNTIESSGYDFSQLLSRQEAVKENVASSEFFSSQPRKEIPSANPFLSPSDNPNTSHTNTGDYLSAIGLLNSNKLKKK